MLLSFRIASSAALRIGLVRSYLNFFANKLCNQSPVFSRREKGSVSFSCVTYTSFFLSEKRLVSLGHPYMLCLLGIRRCTANQWMTWLHAIIWPCIHFPFTIIFAINLTEMYCSLFVNMYFTFKMYILNLFNTNEMRLF